MREHIVDTYCKEGRIVLRWHVPAYPSKDWASMGLTSRRQETDGHLVVWSRWEPEVEIPRNWFLI